MSGPFAGLISAGSGGCSASRRRHLRDEAEAPFGLGAGSCPSGHRDGFFAARTWVCGRSGATHSVPAGSASGRSPSRWRSADRTGCGCSAPSGLKRLARPLRSTMVVIDQTVDLDLELVDLLGQADRLAGLSCGRAACANRSRLFASGRSSGCRRRRSLPRRRSPSPRSSKPVCLPGVQGLDLGLLVLADPLMSRRCFASSSREI